MMKTGQQSVELSFSSPGSDDPEELARLLGTSAFKPHIWSWQFGRYPDRARPVTAYLDGDLAGFNGLMAVDVNIEGRILPAAWSCDFIVKPNYRRRGVGRALKQELDRRCSFLMALGTSEAAASVLSASGWQQGSGPRAYMRVNRALGRGDRLRQFIQAVGRGLARQPEVPADLEVSIAHSLPDDAELDCLWTQAVRGYQRCIVRDAAYLRWRYLGHPLASYRFIQCRDQGTLRALAVARVESKTAWFVDYVGFAEDRDAMLALIDAFLIDAASCRMVGCTTSSLAFQRALLAKGFLPATSKPLRFFVRATDELAPPKPANGWFLMAGDSDGEILAAAHDASWKIREWSEEEFENNRDAWEALLRTSDADPLFMGWDWQHCWWRNFSIRHGLKLVLVAVYDARGSLAGLAPWFIHKKIGPFGDTIRRLEPIGNLWAGAPTMRSEYLSLVVRQGVETEVVRQLCGYMRHSIRWDELAIQDWDATVPSTQLMHEELRSDCWVISQAQPKVDEARYVPLSRGFDGYLAMLGRNARRSLFHRRRYLEGLGKVELEYARPCQVSKWFCDLNRLHSLRWGEPVFTGHRLAFHQDLACRLAKQDRLRFSRLSVNGSVVSVLYHLRGGLREHNLQMGFDDTFHASKISLGLLHLGYAIENAASNGIERVDLLAGAGKQQLFKQRIAPGATPFLRQKYLRSKKAKMLSGARYGLRALVRRGKGESGP